MDDKKDSTMSDQRFIDDIVDRIGKLIPKQPEPGNPAPAPASPLPAWATYILGVILTIALSFIAAKYGVTPMPVPSLQSSPSVVVLQVPAGTTALEVKGAK